MESEPASCTRHSRAPRAEEGGGGGGGGGLAVREGPCCLLPAGPLLTILRLGGVPLDLSLSAFPARAETGAWL